MFIRFCILMAVCLSGVMSRQALAKPIPSAVTAQPAPGNHFAVEDEEAFFNLFDFGRSDLTGVLTAVQAHDWQQAKAAWAAHLQTRERPDWLWSHRDLDAIKEVYAKHFEGFSHSVPAADKVLAREFNFQGVPKTLTHDPQWIQGADEWTNVLNRHEYFKTLGLAYWATGDKRYAEDFVFLLEHWINDNPVPSEVKISWSKFGTSWRTLETGIRANAWLDDLQLFMDVPAFDAEAKYEMTRSLVEHARRLYEHNDGFHQGNWQVAECAGLAEIGIMFPECKEAAAWRERGLAMLTEHMHKDVYPDGAQWEVTPGYHSWVTRQFAEVARLCQLNGYDVPGLLDRHEKMFDFLMEIAKPDRRYPSLGDSGIGTADIREMMGLGALLYKRGDFRFLGPDSIAESWVWIFGPQVEKQYAAVPAVPPNTGSVLLPDARYAVMRTGWKPEDKYFLFNAAPWGGGHNHLDRMEILAYAGRDLLIDPGMYSYDAPLARTYFRKSEAHNVVTIDNQEQPMPPAAKLLSWHTSPEADFVSGDVLEPNGGRHQRSVLFVRPDYWVVVDHVYGVGTHEISRLFHFPLGASATVNGHTVQTTFPGGTNLQIADLSEAEIQLRDGWVPTTLVKADKGQVAALMNHSTLPSVFCTVLVPFEDAAKLPKIERMDAANPLVCKLRVTFPDGQRDEMALAWKTGLCISTGRKRTVARFASATDRARTRRLQSTNKRRRLPEHVFASSLNDLPTIFGFAVALVDPGGETFHAGSLWRPDQRVYPHLPCRHGGVPSVVDDVILPAIGRRNNRVVPGSDYLAGDRPHDLWTPVPPHFSPRSHDLIRHQIIDAVSIVLVIAARIKAVVSAVPLDHARPFQRVPVRDDSTHQTVALVDLPWPVRPHDHHWLPCQFAHRLQAINHQRRAAKSRGIGVVKIGGIEEIPLSVIVAKGV